MKRGLIKMVESKWAVVLVLLSTFVTSGGQIFLKQGSSNLNWDIVGQIANIPLIIGCLLYAIGAVMLIVSLKYGDLSVLYPIYSLNFVWVSILSPYFFASDSMNWVKWLGIAVIMLGVSCVGVGSVRAMKRRVE